MVLEVAHPVVEPVEPLADDGVVSGARLDLPPGHGRVVTGGA